MDTLGLLILSFSDNMLMFQVGSRCADWMAKTAPTNKQTEKNSMTRVNKQLHRYRSMQYLLHLCN